MPTAILIDGAFFVKRFRRIEPTNAYDPVRAAEAAFSWAMAHLEEKHARKHDLYRIFFYDCPPLGKKMHNPVTRKAVDFAKSPEATFRLELHENLRQKRKVALRLGHIADDVTWTLKPEVIKGLLDGKVTLDQLQEEHAVPTFRQKGVDMRIGIDISSLVLKKQVDQIVLIAGDADFVPAAKLARREGVDFILDPMWNHISPSLNEHIDGLRSTCPNPQLKSKIAY